MTVWYAGIGARNTPSRTLAFMATMAAVLGEAGWHLRSGGARGADTAFALGAPEQRQDIISPRQATTAAVTHAAGYHPNFIACSSYAKACHGRNSMILLGRDLSDPVKFVLVWTPDGKAVGGSGQAIRVAEAADIPVFNIAVMSRESIWAELIALSSEYGLPRPYFPTATPST